MVLIRSSPPNLFLYIFKYEESIGDGLGNENCREVGELSFQLHSARLADRVSFSVSKSFIRKTLGCTMNDQDYIDKQRGCEKTKINNIASCRVH